MRVHLTAAAAALTLGLIGLAVPASADAGPNGYKNNKGPYGQGQPYQSQPYQAQPYQGGGQPYDDGEYGDENDGAYNGGYRGGRGGYDDRGFDNAERNFQSWEQNWNDNRHGFHGKHVMSKWKLIRRIERQGYYDVRRLQPSRHGFGWRAFARMRFTGRPVMLRINPFNGQVIAARPLWS